MASGMKISDGTTEIEFFPTSYDMAVEDFTEIQRSSSGNIIAAAAPGGMPPRRTRAIGLLRNTAERDALLDLLLDNDGKALRFTDDVGRVWNARAPGDYESSEDETTSDGAGWHSMRLNLWLESVRDDSAREAYSNVNVDQMWFSRNGAGEGGEPDPDALFFPIAYAPPLGRRNAALAYKRLLPAALALDEGRRNYPRYNQVMHFAGLPRAFISELEDYFMDELKGAARSFEMDHFLVVPETRMRWVGGFAFSQDEGGRYSGTIEVTPDIFG